MHLRCVYGVVCFCIFVCLFCFVLLVWFILVTACRCHGAVVAVFSRVLVGICCNSACFFVLSLIRFMLDVCVSECVTVYVSVCGLFLGFIVAFPFGV